MDKRIGLVGLDTSHAVAFARNLNNAKDPEHVKGARVVVGLPGPSADFELSFGRVEKFTAEVRDQWGVKIVESPEAVAEQCDVLFITSVDGRKHLDFVKRTAKFKKPTFVDKPMALTTADAKEMFRIAGETGYPLCSASALRFADVLNEDLAKNTDTINGCDVYGPMQIQPTQPGFFWYGIHMAEIANRIMGVGCAEVSVATNESCDLLNGVWKDGRMVSIRGMRKGHSRFGATIHREKDSVHLDLSACKKSYYASMLEDVLGGFERGRVAVEAADTLEIVRMLEAGNESRKTGKSVRL
ncbi:MAG TPA: Gfo/Idh/MocA family oxidoreductase [Tepidisphaeraceae bacterium]|nr:Gfo/Idh/MocA family oxidoreductase [Tepidisphaeraceae bacterium]